MSGDVGSTVILSFEFRVVEETEELGFEYREVDLGLGDV